MKKEYAMTTKQLIAKLLELDPDGNKKVYLEKVIYLSDGSYPIQDALTDDHIRIGNKKHNIIKFTM